jgi:hypothetical protein
LELEAMSIVTFETENQIENRLMKRKRMWKNWGATTKEGTLCNGNNRRRERERKRSNIWKRIWGWGDGKLRMDRLLNYFTPTCNKIILSLDFSKIYVTSDKVENLSATLS